MTLSMILAWFTVLFALLTSFKCIARKTCNNNLNRFFSKIHIPFGVIFVIFAILHGILAGNPNWSTLKDFKLAPELFTLNWGTACMLLGIALGITYIFRKSLKRKWIVLHRIFTIALLGCLIIHVLDNGIQLPGRIKEIVDNSENYSLSEDDSLTDSNNDNSTDNSVNKFAGATLKDGTYEGSANGYKGTITVSVTVLNGSVTDIRVIDENDTPDFFSRAETLLDSILSKQTLDVDTVSGATFSSAGLINAVSDALDEAVTSGELDVNEIDMSNINHHGGRH